MLRSVMEKTGPTALGLVRPFERRRPGGLHELVHQRGVSRVVEVGDLGRTRQQASVVAGHLQPGQRVADSGGDARESHLPQRISSRCRTGVARRSRADHVGDPGAESGVFGDMVVRRLQPAVAGGAGHGDGAASGGREALAAGRRPAADRSNARGGAAADPVFQFGQVEASRAATASVDDEILGGVGAIQRTTRGKMCSSLRASPPHSCGAGWHPAKLLWGRQSCLPAGFQPAGPAGMRVRSRIGCPTKGHSWEKCASLTWGLPRPPGRTGPPRSSFPPTGGAESASLPFRSIIGALPASSNSRQVRSLYRIIRPNSRCARARGLRRRRYVSLETGTAVRTRHLASRLIPRSTVDHGGDVTCLRASRAAKSGRTRTPRGKRLRAACAGPSATRAHQCVRF